MGQHRHHTTRSTPQIPTWPPAHSPLPTGEIRGYNIAYGMLVNLFQSCIDHPAWVRPAFLKGPCRERALDWVLRRQRMSRWVREGLAAVFQGLTTRESGAGHVSRRAICASRCLAVNSIDALFEAVCLNQPPTRPLFSANPGPSMIPSRRGTTCFIVRSTRMSLRC